MVLVLTMLTLSASVIPHHHHLEDETACFLLDYGHSDQEEDGDCGGESWNCVAHESYLYHSSVVLEQAVPALLAVIHLEWIPCRQIRSFFDHPLILLPEPPLMRHQGRRAPPCL